MQWVDYKMKLQIFAVLDVYLQLKETERRIDR